MVNSLSLNKKNVQADASLDLIFKNQAMSSRDKGTGNFVNDLLRTEFHKCVISISVALPHIQSVYRLQKVHGEIHQGKVRQLNVLRSSLTPPSVM